MSEIEEKVEAMLDAGEDLPDEVRDELVEADGVTGRLIEIVGDRNLSRLDARGEGWGPIHAAHILAERGDNEAIETLVEILETAEIDDYLTDAAVDALGEFGEEAYELLADKLDALDEEEVEVRARLLRAAAATGADDGGLFDEISKVFDEDAELGAELFADYGDDRALDLLQGALDDAQIKSETRMFANVEILSIADAVQELDGDFSRKQRRKIAYARRRQRKAGNKLRRQLKNS